MNVFIPGLNARTVHKFSYVQYTFTDRIQIRRHHHHLVHD